MVAKNKLAIVQYTHGANMDNLSLDAFPRIYHVVVDILDTCSILTHHCNMNIYQVFDMPYHHWEWLTSSIIHQVNFDPSRYCTFFIHTFWKYIQWCWTTLRPLMMISKSQHSSRFFPKKKVLYLNIYMYTNIVILLPILAPTISNHSTHFKAGRSI